MTATNGLTKLGRAIAAHVKHLDGLVRHDLRDRPELLAGWDSARDVFGPARRKQPPASSEGEAAPSGDIATAA